MRKIQTKKEHERRQRRNNIIASVVMLLVIMLGIVGYAFTGSLQNDANTNSGIQEYNGHEFIVQNGYWVLEENTDLAFVYGPREVPEITIEARENSSINGIQDYYNTPVYIAEIGENSSNTAAKTELYRTLQNYAQRMQGACYLENNSETTNCANDLPLKECNDNLIILNKTKEDSVSIIQKDNCIFINSNEDNMTKTTDAYLYKILGIK